MNCCPSTGPRPERRVPDRQIGERICTWVMQSRRSRIGRLPSIGEDARAWGADPFRLEDYSAASADKRVASVAGGVSDGIKYWYRNV